MVLALMNDLFKFAKPAQGSLSVPLETCSLFYMQKSRNWKGCFNSSHSVDQSVTVRSLKIKLDNAPA